MTAPQAPRIGRERHRDTSIDSRFLLSKISSKIVTISLARVDSNGKMPLSRGKRGKTTTRGRKSPRTPVPNIAVHAEYLQRDPIGQRQHEFHYVD